MYNFGYILQQKLQQMTKFKNGHNTKAGKCDLKPANQTYKNRNYLDIKGYTIVEDSFMITMKE